MMSGAFGIVIGNGANIQLSVSMVQQLQTTPTLS